MPEDIYTGVQEEFDGVCHVKEHDQRGGEFIHVEKICFESSVDSEDNALMIFQFRGLSKLRAVKISADKRGKNKGFDKTLMIVFGVGFALYLVAMLAIGATSIVLHVAVGVIAGIVASYVV